MNKLIELLSQHYKLDRSECEHFLSIFYECDCAKKDTIVIPGRFNDNVYVLREGLLRAYMLTEESDTSLWFAYPGDIVFNVWCYCRQETSPIGIEAMTQVHMMVASKEKLLSMCAKSHPYANAFRKILERHAADYEENAISLLECDGGLERYLSILKRHPELLQHIPLNKLASYLQLAPQSLSRIRARIK